MNKTKLRKRQRELIGQWQTAAWGLSVEEIVEDWAMERARLEAERDEALARGAKLTAREVNRETDRWAILQEPLPATCSRCGCIHALIVPTPGDAKGICLCPRCSYSREHTCPPGVKAVLRWPRPARHAFRSQPTVAR
jgi:hypothetical protein